MQQAKPNVSLTSTNIQNGQKSIPRPRTWNIQVKTYFTENEKKTCTAYAIQIKNWQQQRRKQKKTE